MRKLKRFASVLLALVMCFGLTVTAFATEPTTTYTITINNSTSGYTYTAYQVFDGDIDESGSIATMSNIVWGSNVDYTTTVNSKTIYQALAEIYYTTTDPDDASQTIDVYPFTDDNTATGAVLTSASAVAEALGDYSDDDTVVQAFAEAIKPYITGSGTTSTDNASSDGTYTMTVSSMGYYLVETTGLPTTGYSGADNGAYTRYILVLLDSNGVTVDTKSDYPIVDKEIDADDVDANIGDTIHYTLTATLPTKYADYDTYKLVFHDELSSGLTFDGTSSVTVKVYDSLSEYQADTTGTGGTTVSSGYTVVTDCYHEVSISAFDGSTTYYTYSGGTYTAVESGATYDAGTTYYVKDDCTFEVSIADTKALSDGTNTITTTADSIIVVTFTATLNENAVIGGDGNPNEVYLEYSNNPNSGGEGSTGTTPKDKVVTWTYELDVTKVDGTTGDELENAVFKLYRYDDSGNKEYVVVDSSSKVSTWTTDSDSASKLTSDSSGIFKVIGLDVGTYYLEEVTPPSGYNKLSGDVTLVIAATHTTTDTTGSDSINTIDKLALDTLTITVDSGSAASGDTSTGVVEAEVENNQGTPMPSTGGIGTTIFYVVGGVLVAGAVVLLITRKRMKDDQ